MIYFIISYILNDIVHISGPFCVIFKTFCLIVINYFILTELFFCGFVINSILHLKNSCTHLQVDNRVLVMPRGPLDILEKVLRMHARVVTKPSLATSGQLTIPNHPPTTQNIGGYRLTTPNTCPIDLHVICNTLRPPSTL